MESAVAVIGPPAVGKTTVTSMLGARSSGCAVFRLREHVPEALLAAIAASGEHPGWVDDVTVARVLRRYVQAAIADTAVGAIAMDNFPRSGIQAALLASTFAKLAPACAVYAIELVADPQTLERRVRDRRVCHHCERDPIRDPRLPAEASSGDPRRCARCGSILHPRRSDAPRLVAARVHRYQQEITGIRDAFAGLGIDVRQLDSGRPVEQTIGELSQLLMATADTVRTGEGHGR